MFMPAVFHENLFDDFFDPFWNDGALERAMNREERETFSGTCARSFYVGDAVKKEDIHAKFEDGILHIQLPAPQQQKALPANPNLIEIE